jgi:hypothetical protein
MVAVQMRTVHITEKTGSDIIKGKNMEEKFIEALENDDILFCDKCEKQITEETDYDWKYEDGETKEFVCPNCQAKYKVVIGRPIEKIVYSI